MTRTQLLLASLAEECAEVTQRTMKALRFPLDEVQAGQELDNRQRLHLEITDVEGVIFMLRTEGVLPQMDLKEMMKKARKVEKWLNHSRAVGTLVNEPVPGEGK